VRLEGLGKFEKKKKKKKKKYKDPIGKRTRDLPACSTVPQPTTLRALPRAPITRVEKMINVS
jgi:hypothetical protein